MKNGKKKKIESRKILLLPPIYFDFIKLDAI